MANQQEVIKKFMYSLDRTTLSGTAALNEAIDYATKNSNRHFTTIAKAIAAMKSEISSTNDAEKFLLEKCGIDLSNTDVGAITGSDAGGSKIKTAKSIVPESGKIDTTFKNTSFTANGVTIYLSKFPNYDTTGALDINNNINWEELSSSEKYIWQAFKTWWAENSLKLLGESYGNIYSSTAGKDFYFGFINQKSSDGGYQTAVTSYRNDRVRMAINLAAYSSLKNGGNPDGESSVVPIYLDRTIAHEMTHAVMWTNIDCYESLPQFIKEGMAELTIGVDDKRKDLLRELANSDDEDLDKALSLTDTGTNYTPSYAAGYMFLRWLAKQASDNIINGTAGADSINNTFESTTILAGGGNDTITNSAPNASILGGSGADRIINTRKGYALSLAGSNSYIDGGAGNDYIENHEWADYSFILGGTDDDTILSRATKSTILGGDGNDSIQNITGNVSIHGGAGNDFIFDTGAIGRGNTLIGGAGNDTISLGSSAANNLIRYSVGDGYDIIYNLGASDTISLVGNPQYTRTTVGTSVVVSMSGGAITLSGASGKTVNIVGGKESGGLNVINNSTASKKLTVGSGTSSIKNTSDKVTIVGASAVDSIWNYGASVSVNAGSANDFVDNRGNKVTVLGGAGNDTLRNDTSNSGAKNVKLNGGDGADYFENFGDKVTMLGGAGNDTFLNSDNGSHGSGASVSIDGGAGNDSIKSYGDFVTIVGGSGDDSIINWGLDVSIKGGSGNDTIWGDAGSDTLRGDSGNDKLHGDAGNDKLYGGAGNDSLWGNAGNDKLYGGAGNDTFIYTANEGTDRIYDWESGDMLKILNADGGQGSFKSSKYSGGDLTLSITGGGKVIFDGVSSSDKFNINGMSYSISGSKLK